MEENNDPFKTIDTPVINEPKSQSALKQKDNALPTNNSVFKQFFKNQQKTYGLQKNQPSSKPPILNEIERGFESDVSTQTVNEEEWQSKILKQRKLTGQKRQFQTNEKEDKPNEKKTKIKREL